MHFRKITVLIALCIAAIGGFLIQPADQAQAAAYRFCGEGTEGSFGEIRVRTKNVRTRNVQCRTAFRFAHKLFFSQACIFCDGGYQYGWMRFRGFDCSVRPGNPQSFRCVRGGRRISFGTEAEFP